MVEEGAAATSVVEEGAAATSVVEEGALAPVSKPPGRRRPTRRTVLYLHLSEAALTGHDPLGRVENTRSPVTAEQIRTWCGHPRPTWW